MSVQAIASRFLVAAHINDLTHKSVPPQTSINDDHLPYNEAYFKSIPDQEFINRMIADSKKFYQKAVSESKAAGYWKFPKVPISLSSNSAVYSAAEHLYSRSKKLRGKTYSTRDIMNGCFDFTEARLPGSLTNEELHQIVKDYPKQLEEFYRLYDISLYLEEIRDEHDKEVKELLDVYNDKHVFPSHSIMKPIVYRRMGGLVILEMRNITLTDNEFDQTIRMYSMSTYGYSRLVTMMKDLAWNSLLVCSFSMNMTKEKFTNKFVKMILNIGMVLPEELGGIMKTARHLIFLRQDKDALLDKSSEDYHMSGLADYKSRYSPRLSVFVENSFCDPRDAINYLGLYKIVAHPDIAMDEMFDQIVGFQNPNTIDPDCMGRLEGDLRKRVFRSLSSQGMMPTLKLKNIEDEKIEDEASRPGQSLVNRSHKSTVTISSFMEAGPTLWADTNFNRNERFFNKDEVKIKSSNKSSAVKEKITKEAMNRFANFGLEGNREYFDKHFNTENDLINDYKSHNEPEYAESVKMFEEVMKEFEEFEAEQKSKGVEMDDIDPKVLAEWLLKDPSRYFIVLTEPKLMEVHKPNSRVFYMAMREVKILQQTTERLAKVIGSNDPSISITKDFVKRRREIEEIAHSYTGRPKEFRKDKDFQNDDNIFQTNPKELWNAYLSFDMSEFSKKFPSAPLRMVGDILYELTGEKWFKRIDILFKASVVVHNTRGYSRKIAGVLGGFEGFFNFVWTIIHDTIMTIALEVTGVRGITVTYSDDGHGRVVYGLKANPYRDVLAIQEVYNRYGLIFNLDKTTFSAEIWEYLGVLCIKGMIVPQWVKQFAKMGKITTSMGFNSVANKIEDICAQGRATTIEGSDPFLVSLRINFQSLEVLKRLTPRHSTKDLALLLAIPGSCGGFRTPSITELTSMSKVTTYAEFIADLELLTERFKDYVNRIMERISKELIIGKEAAMGMLTGSFIQTRIRNTAHTGLVAKLLDKVNSKTGKNFPTSPYTDKFKSDVVDFLMKSPLCRHSDISQLLKITPVFMEYADAVSVVRSSSLIRMVRRSVVSKAQRKDTLYSIEDINNWVKIFRNPKKAKDVMSASEFNQAVYDSYEKLRFLPEPESSRVALIRTKDVNAHIYADTRLDSRLSIKDQSYIEPVMAFLSDTYVSSYYNETSHNSFQRRMRQYIIMVTKMISSDPSIVDLFTMVNISLNIPTPRIGGSLAKSSKRIVGKKSGDVLTFTRGEQPFHAKTTSRMTHHLYSSTDLTDKADRTTYIELAKIHHMLSCNTFHKVNSMPDMEHIQTRYYVRNIPLNMNHNPAKYLKKMQYYKTDPSLTELMQRTLLEHDQRYMMIDNILDEVSLYDSVDRLGHPLVRAVILKKFINFLWPIMASPDSLQVSSGAAMIPEFNRRDVVAEGIVFVSYQKSSAMSKAILRDYFVKNVDEVSIASAYDHELEEYCVVDKDFGKILDKANDFLLYIMSAVRSIQNITLLGENIPEINEYFISTKLFRSAFFKCMGRMGNYLPKRLPNVILTRNKDESKGMTPGHQKSLRDAMNIKIAELSVEVSKHAEELNNMDNNIDMLIVANSIIRGSNHRDSAYNHVMAVVHYMKFLFYLVDVYEYEEMTGERLKLEEVEMNSMFRNTLIRELGTDKRTGKPRPDIRKAIDGPLLLQCGKRVNKLLNYAFKVKNLEKKICTIQNKFSSPKGINLMIKISFGISQHVWENIVKTSYDSIINVSTDLCYDMCDSLKTSPSDLVVRIPHHILTPSEVLGGKIIRPSALLPNLSKKSSLLLRNLHNLHSLKWGNCIEEVDRDLLLSYKNVKDFYDVTVDDCEYKFAVRRFYNMDYAMSSFSLVSRTPGAVGMLLRSVDRETGGFWIYLIYLGPSMESYYNSSMDNKPGTFSHADIFDQYIFPDLVSASEGLRGELEDREDEASIKNKFKMFTSLTTARSILTGIGDHRQTIDDDLLLVGINEAFRGESAESHAIKCYIMMLSWARYNFKPTGEQVRETKDLVMKNLAGNNITRKLNDDISYTWLWLQMSGIRPGITLDYKRIQQVVRICHKMPNPGKVYATATRFAIKNVKSAKECIANCNEIKVGELSDLLFANSLPLIDVKKITYREDESDDDYEMNL